MVILPKIFLKVFLKQMGFVLPPKLFKRESPIVLNIYWQVVVSFNLHILFS